MKLRRSRARSPRRRRDLRHTLFRWFGVAILASAIAAIGVSALLGPGRVGFNDELQRAKQLVSRLFAERWHDPEQRARLAQALAEEGSFGLALTDAAARPISRHGTPCRGPAERIAVREHGALLGYVSVCVHRDVRPYWLLGLLAAAGTLWLLSGKIAWRLARPLTELARTARELADGRLDARARSTNSQVSEMAVLADSFNHMAARIERQISEQKQLLATVSHEMRTPLTRMRLLLEMLRDRAPGAEEARALDELEAEIVEMDELVGQTLASSRLDFAALQPRRLDVRELCARALSRAGLSDDQLDVQPEPALEIDGDPTLLARALANLLGNAKKHGGGVDRLQVRAGAREVCFEVQDRGDGIDAALGDALFQPFTRGKESDAGLGLGLALVERIARAHGGRVWALRRDPCGAAVGFSVARTETEHAAART
jgi:two-component system, OmpR family, sensor kinase